MRTYPSYLCALSIFSILSVFAEVPIARPSLRGQPSIHEIRHGRMTRAWWDFFGKVVSLTFLKYFVDLSNKTKYR